MQFGQERRLWTRVGLLLAASLLVALLGNIVRSQPLPWIAPRPYNVLHDCPEATESAVAATPAQALGKAGRLVFVDSRAPAEFRKSHLEGALNVPYDPLYPVKDSDLAAIKSRKGTWIVVYGDPETGRLLADDLASQGLRGVLAVDGGLQALRTAGARVLEEGIR